MLVQWGACDQRLLGGQTELRTAPALVMPASGLYGLLRSGAGSVVVCYEVSRFSICLLRSAAPHRTLGVGRVTSECPAAMI